jgi:tetratricopeptide (TPR) repeat protein
MPHNLLQKNQTNPIASFDESIRDSYIVQEKWDELIVYLFPFLESDVQFTEIATAFNMKAKRHFYQKEYDNAIESAQIAIAYHNRSLPLNDSNRQEVISHVIVSYINLGVYYDKKANDHLAKGEYDLAEALYIEAVKHNKVAHEIYIVADDIYPEYQIVITNLSESYSNLGMLYGRGAKDHYAKGEYDRALVFETRAFEYYNLALSFNPNNQIRNQLPVSYSNLGNIYCCKAKDLLKQQQYDHALTLQTESMKCFKQALFINPNYSLAKEQIAYSYMMLSSIYKEKNDLENSWQSILKAQKIDISHDDLRRNIQEIFEELNFVRGQSNISSSSSDATPSSSWQQTVGGDSEQNPPRDSSLKHVTRLAKQKSNQLSANVGMSTI